MFKLCSSLVLVAACVACGGNSFSANNGGPGSAGEASGGQASSAGSSSGGDAGESNVGGTSSGGNPGSDTGGAGASTGGAADAGGADAGGSAGTSTGADCVKLKQDYQAAVEKARACDKGSTDQCSASSTVEPLSCGCPVLVNAKSEYTTVAKKVRQAFRDAKCVEGALCSAIACAPITAATCTVAVTTGSNFVCTAVTAIAN